jgi:hypothetical protein
LSAEFVFEGGIILVANTALSDVPQLRAVKTRIPALHYQPTNQEVAALMRSIARDGHRHGQHKLSPDACKEVVGEIIDRANRLKRNLDLRLMVNTFLDRLQWENGEAELHWVDHLETRMRERVLASANALGVRAAYKDKEFGVLRQIASLPPQERLEIWTKETGKSQAALYRRLPFKERVLAEFLIDRLEERLAFIEFWSRIGQTVRP